MTYRLRSQNLGTIEDERGRTVAIAITLHDAQKIVDALALHEAHTFTAGQRDSLSVAVRAFLAAPAASRDTAMGELRNAVARLDAQDRLRNGTNAGMSRP